MQSLNCWSDYKLNKFLSADFQVKVFGLWFQSGRAPKYQNIVNICQNIKIKFRFKIAKYRLYRRRFWRSRRHFSAFFKLYQKKKAENASELQKSHKTFAPKFWKCSKIRQNVLYFDILAVCSILIFYWYFVLVFWNLRKSAARIHARTKSTSRLGSSLI